MIRSIIVSAALLGGSAANAMQAHCAAHQKVKESIGGAYGTAARAVQLQGPQLALEFFINMSTGVTYVSLFNDESRYCFVFDNEDFAAEMFVSAFEQKKLLPKMLIATVME